MPAFCVYGISKGTCLVIAEKKVPIEVKRRLLPLAEWAALRDKLAMELFETLERRVKVSPEFDAPQFCYDWLAIDPSYVRSPVVMVRGQKIDKKGDLVVRNGAPVMAWLAYKAGK